MTEREANVRQKCWAVQKGIGKGNLPIYSLGYSNGKQ